MRMRTPKRSLALNMFRRLTRTKCRTIKGMKTPILILVGGIVLGALAYAGV
jgi:hypothetical protein